MREKPPLVYLFKYTIGVFVYTIGVFVGFSFSLLIMYGISYMFRHYIAILRERS
jgi:hypothetical protein